MANYLRIVYHNLLLKFIVWIGCHAPSLGRVVFLLLATIQIYKTVATEKCCSFHGAQYLLDLLHECRQLPLEFIA